MTNIGINFDENKPKLSATIPFAIHPMLVIRYFYNKDYEKKIIKIENDENNNTYSEFSLGRRFKEGHQPLAEKLIQNHYDATNYLQHLENEHVSTNAIRRKIKGEAENCNTQDLILAKMADHYLTESNDTYKAFLKELSKGAEWQAQSMRKTIVKYEISHSTYGKVEFSIRFHQLDDYLLVESKEVIKKAIAQVLKRHLELPNSRINNITKSSEGYQVPYEEVFKEIQRVYNDALDWANYLLEWERTVIKRKQDWNETYIDFLRVCKEAQLDEVKTAFLNNLRKNIFHAKIPTEYAYWELRRSEKYDWLRKLVRFGFVREQKSKNVNYKKS